MDNFISGELLNKYDYWSLVVGENEKRYRIDEAKKLKEFLSLYPVERIGLMSIDDYVVGKHTNSSFCWWVENKLRSLGNIGRGRLNAYQLYGIYYNSKAGEYLFGGKKTRKTRFGSSKDEIFSNVRSSIVDLVNDTKAKNYQAMVDCKLNPLFKNKIIYLYDSDNWIPIYSDSDLDILLTVFGVPFNKNEDRIFKRMALFSFMKGLNRPDITPLSFMDFIYSDLGYHSILRSNENISPISSTAEDTYQLKDITDLAELAPKEASSNAHGLVSINPLSYEQKRITGKKGEQIVKEYLQNHKKELGIAGEIYCACEHDDHEHFDFSYKDLSGETVYIDSKATKPDRKLNILFEMSQAEYAFMNDHTDSYFIFYINDVFKGKIIKRIKASSIIARPTQYGVSLTEVEQKH